VQRIKRKSGEEEWRGEEKRGEERIEGVSEDEKSEPHGYGIVYGASRRVSI
jgi:hypothetical protein